ncbi:MAG: simple sugar transport system permease protein [Clostridiales bacterium]|jgi:simple sugar transport system permease protein|nr:simple sugar transport system permease protein [Clostridiales bacterium]MDK2934222.1 simple sugar transport system permease protein [Clostridiales bacterium]
MSVQINKQREIKSFERLKDLKAFHFIIEDSNLTRLFLIMIFIFVLMTAMKPELFPTIDNLSSMAFQFPEFGILAIAMMIAMLTGGIDLSIIGIANLSGILAALTMVKLIPEGSSFNHVMLVILLAMAVSALTGILCGLFNGFAVARIGIPPILTTLGTMQLFTGIAIVITKGTAVYGLPAQFSYIGNGTLWILPIPLMIFIVFAAIFTVILHKTSFGLKLYMMGTNPTASRFSGINNAVMLMKTYMMSGLLAAFSGLIIIARTNSAKADYGTSYTLQALLVAVMAGVNPNGGFGKVTGIVFAVLTLQFLSSGFNMLHFSNFFKDFVWGAVLLIVMVTNYIINHSKKKVSKNTNK